MGVLLVVVPMLKLVVLLPKILILVPLLLKCPTTPLKRIVPVVKKKVTSQPYALYQAQSCEGVTNRL